MAGVSDYCSKCRAKCEATASGSTAPTDANAVGDSSTAAGGGDGEGSSGVGGEGDSSSVVDGAAGAKARARARPSKSKRKGKVPAKDKKSRGGKSKGIAKKGAKSAKKGKGNAKGAAKGVTKGGKGAKGKEASAIAKKAAAAAARLAVAQEKAAAVAARVAARVAASRERTAARLAAKAAAKMAAKAAAAAVVRFPPAHTAMVDDATQAAAPPTLVCGTLPTVANAANLAALTLQTLRHPPPALAPPRAVATSGAAASAAADPSAQSDAQGATASASPAASVPSSAAASPPACASACPEALTAGPKEAGPGADDAGADDAFEASEGKVLAVVADAPAPPPPSTAAADALANRMGGATASPEAQHAPPSPPPPPLSRLVVLMCVEAAELLEGDGMEPWRSLDARAKAAKGRGDACFRAEQWRESADCYTAGLTLAMHGGGVVPLTSHVRSADGASSPLLEANGGQPSEGGMEAQAQRPTAGNELVGMVIEVYWPLDEAWYAARVMHFIANDGEDQQKGDRWRVKYLADRVVEELDLNAEQWRIKDCGAPNTAEAVAEGAPTAAKTEAQKEASRQLIVVLLSSRAEARIQMGQWSAAVDDCEEALSINATHARSLSRLERARRGAAEAEAAASTSPAAHKAQQLAAAAKEDVEGLGSLDLDLRVRHSALAFGRALTKARPTAPAAAPTPQSAQPPAPSCEHADEAPVAPAAGPPPHPLATPIGSSPSLQQPLAAGHRHRLCHA